MLEGNVTRSEILPLLGDVKIEGEWVMAFCPAHADGQKHGMKAGRSLGLSKAGVLKCYAGCTFKDVMEALRGRKPEQTKATPVEQWPREPVRVYEYVNQAGELLAVKGRFEKPNPDGGKPEKKFLWRLPEGTYGEGLKGGKVTDMPLWGIGLLSNPGRVWFTEGEEAARALQGRNEIAVCGAWGASQRDFGTALGVLTGRTVILWPDNDPPGREYMAEIRKALRGVAQSVISVSAPVPPKGDAVEFFQMGGKLDDLLANVLERPTVDVLSGNHLIVRVPSEEGPIRFDFDRIMRSSGAMECELTVSHMNPAAESEPYGLRINLLSPSARSALETALGKQFGKAVNWTTLVSTAFARVRTTHNELDRTTHVSALPEMENPEFLIDTLLPEESDTIIFGDGSSGKTYLAYSMALEIATGGAFCGHRVKRGAVLILDYETGAKMAKLRLRRLMLGIGLDPALLGELPIHYLDAEGVPLPELKDAIRATIDRHDIKLMIIDSAGDACGGEPEKAGVVLSYFNACMELKCTRLHIAHVTNAEMEVSAKRPFGSRYWHNRARRTWFVKRDQEEETDIIDIGLICRKVNDGRLPKPLAFQVAFTGDAGPVRLRAEDFREVVAFEKDQAHADRVASFLAGASGPMLIADIAKETGLDGGQVRVILNRKKGKMFTLISKDGAQNRWALLGREA